MPFGRTVIDAYIMSFFSRGGGGKLLAERPFYKPKKKALFQNPSKLDRVCFSLLISEKKIF